MTIPEIVGLAISCLVIACGIIIAVLFLCGYLTYKDLCHRKESVDKLEQSPYVGALGPNLSQLHALPLGGGADAVARLVGVARFETRCPVVETDELIGVAETESATPKSVHPDGGVVADLRMMKEKVAAHEGDVIGGGEVPLGGEACAVDEVGVQHAEGAGAVIHLFHEQLRDTRNMLGESHGGVVARGDTQGFEKIIHGDLLSLGEEHL